MASARSIALHDEKSGILFRHTEIISRQCSSVKQTTKQKPKATKNKAC